MSAEQQRPFSFTDPFDGNGPLTDARLSQLYLERIEPIIKRYIGSKLRVSLRPNDDSRQNQDGLEMMSEAKVLLLQRLAHQRGQIGEDGINDLDAYVRTVASNVVNQHLRRKYPRRLSLKNQFRYLLTHHKRLALWKNEDDRSICGLAGSDGAEAKRISLTNDERSVLLSRIHRPRSESSARELIEFTVGVFELHNAAATLDDLVTVACDVLAIEEPTEISEPENIAELRTSSGRATALSTLEDIEFVRRVWTEVMQLPIKHRTALLLNFKDNAGENLITMLPVMRIASVRQIADALAFEHEHFARVWNELPWDDNRIAEHLDLNRQQVINLRQSARQMLRRKLRPTN